MEREHQLVPRARREQQAKDDGAPRLGDVAKDVIDHAQMLVSDAVAIAKLEARQMTGRLERSIRRVVPRIALGATAAVLGITGVVLGLIAIFIGLGNAIPSVAVRL